MWKRSFAPLMIISALIVLTGCQEMVKARPVDSKTSTAALESGDVQYQVVERMVVENKGPGIPTKHNLWVALIQDQAPYQEVLNQTISPDDYILVTDEYGNQYVEFDLADMQPGSSIPIEIRYDVKVHDVMVDLNHCQGELPDFFTEPELHIESRNPQIVELAEQLSKGKDTACDQVRAFYDYIGDDLLYTYNGASWGAQAALGEMGSDCTEYSSLLIALSRATGIPARYLEGLNHNVSDTDGLARREHAWVEVYLPGSGWTPLDPTLGRSSLTRDNHFAHATANHIIVTRGRNPSTLRDGSYFTHLYWPGPSADIRIQDFEWDITTTP